MKLVGQTSLRVETGSVSSLDGYAMGTMTAETTQMKPSVQLRRVSLKHISLARMDIVSRPGGDAMVT